MARSNAFARIRAEVIRLTGLIPRGRFTTYGSIATHMNSNPRHVAHVLARLDEAESAALPWHRVVAADARISRGMDPSLADRQRELLRSEGIEFDENGCIRNADHHFHVVGLRRDIRWSDPP